MDSTSQARDGFKTWIQPGLAAVRRHWPALVLIQICAVLLVVAYYHSAGLRQGTSSIADLRVRYTEFFAFGVGILAGGIVPELAKLLTGGLKRLDRAWLAESVYNGLVYGVIAVEVDLFYRLQTVVFGASNAPGTLAIKTAVDMLIFTPSLAIPTATFLLVWRNLKFNASDVLAGGFRRFYLSRVMPGLIPCWFFWTPMLFCTYAMPTNLQLVFANLAEAAWSILFVFISKADAPETFAP